MQQMINEVRELVAQGIDSTTACIRVALAHDVSAQSLINAYLWS